MRPSRTRSSVATLSRTGACALWPASARSRAGRRRSPCGRETRAVACGRCCSADTCASRRSLPPDPCQTRALCIGRAQLPVKRAPAGGRRRPDRHLSDHARRSFGPFTIPRSYMVPLTQIATLARRSNGPSSASPRRAAPGARASERRRGARRVVTCGDAGGGGDGLD
jgi:hypothetical protein